MTRKKIFFVKKTSGNDISTDIGTIIPEDFHPSPDRYISIAIADAELVSFAKEQGCPLIIFPEDDGTVSLEIYDDYRE